MSVKMATKRSALNKVGDDTVTEMRSMASIPIWVAKVLLNPKPANPVEAQNSASLESSMPVEEVAGFARDRIHLANDGFDRWAAAAVCSVDGTLKHRAEVRRHNVLKKSDAADQVAVDSASSIAYHAVEALASWTPEYFERIAYWMRHCEQKSMPTWATLACEIHDAMKAEGVEVTKAKLKGWCIGRMKEIAGREVLEPTKWPDVWKAAGLVELKEGRRGPSPGFASARRKAKAVRT